MEPQPIVEEEDEEEDDDDFSALTAAMVSWVAQLTQEQCTKVALSTPLFTACISGREQRRVNSEKSNQAIRKCSC